MQSGPPGIWAAPRGEDLRREQILIALIIRSTVRSTEFVAGSCVHALPREQCSVLALLQGRRGGTRARRRRGRREEGGGRREARGERGEGSSENEKGEGEREGEEGGGRREGFLRFPGNPLRKLLRSTRGAPPNQSVARCIAQTQSVSACVC
eukprot:COSAG02_NODE_8057_length_2728_cov_125.326740_1_plen_152_part_00